MNLTRRSLFASAVALLALPRKVAAERLLGPARSGNWNVYGDWSNRPSTYTLSREHLENVMKQMNGPPLKFHIHPVQEKYLMHPDRYRFYVGNRP